MIISSNKTIIIAKHAISMRILAVALHVPFDAIKDIRLPIQVVDGFLVAVDEIRKSAR